VFATEIAVILETVRNRPMVTMDHWYEVTGSRSIHVNSIILSDLDTREDTRGLTFRQILHVYSYRLTNSDQIQHANPRATWEGTCYHGRGQPHPTC